MLGSWYRVRGRADGVLTSLVPWLSCVSGENIHTVCAFSSPRISENLENYHKIYPHITLNLLYPQTSVSLNPWPMHMGVTWYKATWRMNTALLLVHVCNCFLNLFQLLPSNNRLILTHGQTLHKRTTIAVLIKVHGNHGCKEVYLHI